MGLFEGFKKNAGQEPSEQSTDILPVKDTSVTASESIGSLTEQIIMEIDTVPRKADAVILPIAELGTLGNAAASLLPSFRTITQTTAVNTDGLFRLANASVGDTLKKAKDGNFCNSTWYYYAAFARSNGKNTDLNWRNTE